jgi:hypothetical protein
MAFNEGVSGGRTGWPAGLPSPDTPSRKVYGEPSPTRTGSGSTTEESLAKTIRRGSKSCRRSIQARAGSLPLRLRSAQLGSVGARGVVRLTSEDDGPITTADDQ